MLKGIVIPLKEHGSRLARMWVRTLMVQAKTGEGTGNALREHGVCC